MQEILNFFMHVNFQPISGVDQVVHKFAIAFLGAPNGQIHQLRAIWRQIKEDPHDLGTLQCAVH